MNEKTGTLQIEANDETSKWNQQQGLNAHQRIQSAVASLLEREGLPAGITERFDALTAMASVVQPCIDTGICSILFERGDC